MERQSQGMLVLSRQRDQVVMIGDQIEICVVDIRFWDCFSLYTLSDLQEVHKR